MKNVKDDHDRYDDDRVNDPKLMTEAQLRAGMLFPGNRAEYEAELKRRGKRP